MPDVVVQNRVVVDSRHITADLVIAPTAAGGAKTLHVTTPGGETTAPFTVIALAAPLLQSVSPASGTQGTAVPVTLLGSGFRVGASISVSGTGVTVSSVVRVNDGTLTATFTVASNATASSRLVTVTTDIGTSNTVAFAVVSGVAGIPNREFWLDATVDATITVATGVSAWADVTGNGRVMVQATGSKQPAKQAAAINGLQAVRFDGVNDALTMAWPSAAQLNTGSSVFIVANVRFTNDATYRPLARWFPSNAIGLQHEANNDGSSPQKLEVFCGTNIGLVRATPGELTTTGTRLVEGTASAAAGITLYKNGVLAAGSVGGFASINSSVGDTLALGGDDTPTNFGTYDIGEMLVFSRVLGLAERQLVESYLMTKWGLP